MTFISYAQNFEDVMIWRALKHIDRGFYIDVGAAWSKADSVTYAFYERGWSGINIEPNPDLAKLLEQERSRDTNIQMAVSDSSGLMKMNSVKMGDAVNFGLSTLDQEVSSGYANQGFELVEIEVQVTTLSEICAEFVSSEPHIHFLKIDVEGLEKAVLGGMDFEKFRPWIVIVEATKPMTQTECHEEWEPILLSASYALAYCDGLNRFYVSNEHPELLESFRFPPNVFDEFESYEQNQLRQRSKSLERQVGELEHFREEVGRLQSELEFIRSSRSWRVTAPLRKAIKIFRKE